MFKIKKDKLKMFEIKSDYFNYLRKFDNRVSTKDNRKFYGIIVQNENVDYYIPFTSKIEKKTNSKLTINIKEKNKTISKLLLNNMIPVKENNTKLVDVNNSKYYDYYKDELRYLERNEVIDEILRKANNLFNVLDNQEHRDYSFFKNICCDFKLLEEKCREYKR